MRRQKRGVAHTRCGGRGLLRLRKGGRGHGRCRCMASATGHGGSEGRGLNGRGRGLAGQNFSAVIDCPITSP